MLTRGRIILLGVALFSTYAYFYQAGGWNQDSRFDLVRAIVERGTLKSTGTAGDASGVGIERYNDKAPGHALLAVPFVAVARLGMKLAGASPVSPASLMWLLYLASLITAALPATFAVVGLLWLGRKLGGTDGGALFGALVLGLGTPLTVYAMLFWCHALAAALLFFAFMAAVGLRDRPGLAGFPDLPDLRRDWLLGMAVGLAGGWAAISEYPAAVTAALLAGLALLHACPDGLWRMLRVAAGITLGVLPCVLVLMVYNKANFGSPFALSDPHPANVVPVRELFKLPSGSNLGLTLFGEYRGLLPLSPVLIFSPLGAGMLLLRSRRRALAAVCWLVPAFYFLLNSSYVGWFGGWSYGPRNVASALPFLALPLVVVWSTSGWLVRVPMLAAGIYGMAFALLAAAVTGQPPASQYSPIAKLWWANFTTGKFSLFPNSWNWGQRFGLEGHASLIPLLSLWLLAAVVWVVLPRLRWLRKLPGPPRRKSRESEPIPAPVDPAPDPLHVEPSEPIPATVDSPADPMRR